MGGSWGDPTDILTYRPGARTHRDTKRDTTPNGYYSFVGFYFLMYLDAGDVTKQKRRLILPVNPESFSVTQARSYGTYDLVAGKQGMQIGQMQLRQIAFSSFFPAVYEEDYCVGHYLDYVGNSNRIDPDPMLAVKWIQTQQRAAKPLYFAGLPISQGDQEPGQQVLEELSCHITSFTYTYQAGNPRDIFYDLELTEHRDLKVTKTKGKPPSGPKVPTIKKVTSKIGESFIDIAKAEYGPNYGSYATKLKENNPGVEYANPKNKALGAALKKGSSVKLDIK